VSYRYIGNKTRLTTELVSEVRKNLRSGGTVADIMCGTASVSESLRTSGYTVIASDIMTFAVHHARVRLLLSEPPPFRSIGATYGAVHRELGGLDPIEGYFFREFSPEGIPLNGSAPRKYFSAENAGKIDAINAAIREWHDRGQLSEIEHSLLRHDLILAANRVANIAGTYGHFRSEWSESALLPLRLQPADITWGYPTDHRVLQGPAEKLAKSISADLCYIDPPYMKRQYAANYHIIETLARGDEPESVGVSGLRPWRDQYSDFCSKVRIRDSFRAIFRAMDCPAFLISYSEDGLLSEGSLLELFGEFGEVSLRKIPFPRFRSNDSNLSSTVNEYIFTLRRPQ
jgi:adenine-specific DNA-methyltransferase